MGKVKKGFDDTLGYLGNLVQSAKVGFNNFVGDAKEKYPSFSGQFSAGSGAVPGAGTGGENGVVLTGGQLPEGSGVVPGVSTGGGTGGGSEAPGVGTGGGNTEGGASGGNTPKLTDYEKYLADTEKSIGEYTKYLNQDAQDNKTKATEAAQKEFERASVDANAAYQRNLATYGAKAEALDRMGLTGSGYSDYLAGNAYSNMRNDIGIATREKNAAEIAANEGYEKALRETNLWKTEKTLELNKEKALYSEQMRQENEAKKQTLKSELMTMAQNGASIEDIRNYIAASGVTFTTPEITALGAISDRVIGRMKSEIIAQGLTQALDDEAIKAIANANGIALSPEEIADYENALAKIREELDAEQKEQFARDLGIAIMSSNGEVSESTIKGILDLYGIEPDSEAGETILGMIGGSEDDVYDGGIEGATLAAGATASKSGPKWKGGNVVVKIDGVGEYTVQRAEGEALEDNNHISRALTDAYRQANDLSVDKWKELSEDSVAGAVASYNDDVYAYLEDKNGKYGWIKLEKTPTDGAFKGPLDYDDLKKALKMPNGQSGDDTSGENTSAPAENTETIVTDNAKVRKGTVNTIFADGKKGDNFSIKIGNDTYRVERASDSRVEGSNGEALSAAYREAMGIKEEEWKDKPDEEVAGAVIKTGGKLYVYLDTKDQGWGWVEIRARKTEEGKEDSYYEQLKNTMTPKTADQVPDGSVVEGAKAKRSFISGGKQSGNVTIKKGDETYYVERASGNRESDRAITDKLTGLVEDFSTKEDKEVEGTVVKLGNDLYAYLKDSDGKYGWFKLRKRTLDGLFGGDVSYDKLLNG